MNIISSRIVIVLLSIIGQSCSSVISTSNLTSSLSYSDYLGTSNPRFTRPNSYSGYYYYYKILKLTVYTSDTYQISSSGSTINMFGCLYETFFDPSYPLTNLLSYNDGSSTGGQFTINYNLLNGNTYMFVVTTSSPYETGGFTVTASGSFVHTLQPLTTTISSGYLWSSNPTFNRPNGYSSSYYYDTYDVTVSTTGTYTFTSRSSGSIDSYGCLYQGSFSASNPTWNMVVCDDDSGGGVEFLLRRNLYESNRYILVVTTSLPYQTGSYSIATEGSSSLILSITTPSRHYNFPLIEVLSGVFGLIGLTIILLIIVRICRRRQRTIVYQTPNRNGPSYNSFGTTNKY